LLALKSIVDTLRHFVCLTSSKAPVAPGYWELTRLKVQMRGKALFSKPSAYSRTIPVANSNNFLTHNNCKSSRDVAEADYIRSRSGQEQPVFAKTRSRVGFSAASRAPAIARGDCLQVGRKQSINRFSAPPGLLIYSC